MAKGREDRQMITILSLNASKTLGATKNVQEKRNEKWQEQHNPSPSLPQPRPQIKPAKRQVEDTWEKSNSVQSNLCLQLSKYVCGIISLE